MSPPVLFAIATAIWGSTWLGIKFQLGTVAPLVSIAYRFALAALLLGAWCVATRRTLVFPARAHAWFAAQGATFFGLNYATIYEAERHVASGLVAVVFSTIVFMTPIGVRLCFGTPISLRLGMGATLGVVGVALLFLPQILSARAGGEPALGIGLALGGTLIATIGNLISMRMQRDQLPILSSTAWGMAYGALTVTLVAVATGTPWSFDPRWPYVASLAYLSVLGSIVAFVAYLRLLKETGAGLASFVGVSTPVLAMLLSTLAEGYRWTPLAIAGVVLAVIGNVIALRTPAGKVARGSAARGVP